MVAVHEAAPQRMMVGVMCMGRRRKAVMLVEDHEEFLKMLFWGEELEVGFRGIDSPALKETVILTNPSVTATALYFFRMTVFLQLSMLAYATVVTP